MVSFRYTLAVLTILIVQIFSNKTEKSLEDFWKEEDWGKIPKDPTDIFSILFRRFADTKNGLTASRFEEVIQCSTGLSECPQISSFQEEPFLYLIDCQINSGLSPLLCDTLENCQKGKDLLSLLPQFNATTDLITEDHFKNLLSISIYQTQSHVCEQERKDLEEKENKKSSLEVWGYGILFVTLISACSLAGVSVLPMMARDFYEKLLTALIGLAVGSLASSAVFHLIPQAYGINTTENDHHYLFMSLFILLGIWAFFMIERIMKLVIIMQKLSEEKIPSSTSTQAILKLPTELEDKKLNSYGKIEHYGVEAGSSLAGKPNKNDVQAAESGSVDQEESSADAECQSIAPLDIGHIYASQAIKASFGHEQKPSKSSHVCQEVTFTQGKDSVIATVAWMIIFGDGFHNFIDGVSIGAAFQESILTGVSISLAVICEELPHELGDFAILLKAGMTMKQALFYNFLSATTCYVGLVIGILIGEFTQDSTYIFAIAAGMFLYISLVDMVPEMNEIATAAAEVSVREVVFVLFLQNIGLFLGVASLFVLAYFQDSIDLGG